MMKEVGKIYYSPRKHKKLPKTVFWEPPAKFLEKRTKALKKYETEKSR